MSKLIKPEVSDPASLRPIEPDAALLDPAVIALLACPACLGELCALAGRLSCAACGRSYPAVDGIPVLIVERAE